jgi:hypothetical protein
MFREVKNFGNTSLEDFLKVLETYVASSFKTEAVLLENFGTKLLDYTALQLCTLDMCTFPGIEWKISISLYNY